MQLKRKPLYSPWQPIVALVVSSNRVAGAGQSAEADRGKFKVPTLRNVALTAPYMHDGRFATLEEVVEHYNAGVRPSPTLDPNLAKHPVSGLGLNAADKAALVAFLKTLTDEQFVISQFSTNQLSQAQ